ncbi:MAG: type II toxin-antitoxin system HipA family toxin [Balneolaceae bacterium]
MKLFDRCPGTLREGHSSYSRTCLNKVFDGKKVHPFLSYSSPSFNGITNEMFDDSRKRTSISGVQEKFSLLQEKNKLRLINEGEQGTHILKPIPLAGKNAEYMPANEHLTMQIAAQVFHIPTAENALIFFNDGQPAYITKRFDVNPDGSKLAQEDFASLAKRTPHTHGEHYKYKGNYFQLFELLQQFVPAYPIESVKLFKVLVFNYLFSNGDAHFKNFSLIETKQGDFKLSPAYDLLSSRLHINDSDFALEEGLLPKALAQGTVYEQFMRLAVIALIPKTLVIKIFDTLLTNRKSVERLITRSCLSESLQRNYIQAYQTRIKKLTKTL